MKLSKQPVYNSSLHPAVKTLVDYMPIAVFAGKPPPFTAVFANIQQRVYERHVVHGHIAALGGQDVFEFVVLFLIYFYTGIIAHLVMFCNREHDLKRHGWRKVKPRPRRPGKASDEEIASSKKLTKNSERSYWKKIEETIATSARNISA